MKILLCGGGKSAFRDNLVSRLYKEKHEIFILTGNKTESEKNEKGVFQKYVFPYMEKGIANIIGNISPDMVVFLGAMDTNYGAEWKKTDAVSYISGLTNVLLCAQNSGVKSFFYLSDLNIYKDNEEITITNETVPTPKSTREESILQGEAICQFYHTERFEVRILRFANIYGGFGRYILNDAVVEPMREAILANEKMVCQSGKNYYLLDIGDATDAVCRLMFKRGAGTPIRSAVGRCISETELAEKLSHLLGKNLQIETTEHTIPGKEYCFDLEYDYEFRQKYTVQEGLKRYIKQRNNAKKEDDIRKKETKKKRKLEFLRPLLETLMVFVVVLFVQYFGIDSQILEYMDFYLLFIVLIAAVHGTNFGLLALLLSVMSKFAIEIEEYGLEVIVLDYSKYLWVLQILVAGVLVGFMRDKYWRKSLDLNDELEYCKVELENLGRINESNVYIKNIYEKRLLNYKNSMAHIYEITSQLDLMDSRRVAFTTVDVVKDIMECPAVSIYIRNQKGPFFRMIASNSADYKGIGKTICYDEKLAMYDMLEEDGIYRNYKMDEKLPVMASAIRDEHGTQTIVMVWSVDLNYINQYQVNLFRVLSRLIEKSMARANAYMEEMYQNSRLPGTRVTKPESYEEILESYREGKERGVFEYAILQIKKEFGMSDADWLSYLNKVQGMLRDTDLVALDQDGTGKIVLAASSEADADFVIKRLASNNVETVFIE